MSKFRRYTPKTARRYEASDDARQSLRLRISCCELCGNDSFALHEIPRANIRSYIADNPACIIGLCDPGCHQIAGNWPKPKQLCLLRERRNEDFNLEEYNRWAVARVAVEDVDEWVDEVRELICRS